jgi:hypothetical protein
MLHVFRVERRREFLGEHSQRRDSGVAWRQMLKAALAALESGGAESNGRKGLQVAGREFWKAMFFSASWTQQNREEAHGIADILLADGRMEQTIDGMDDGKIRVASQELDAFCKRMGELPLQPDEEPTEWHQHRPLVPSDPKGYLPA